MRVILGVDGGGSKTHAVVADESGNKLGEGVSGPGNHQGCGIEIALENVRQAALDALAEAHVTADDVSFVQYGLAGADREHDYQILRPALSTLPFTQYDIVCDTLEGLRTGSPDNIGVVLVCGSGTNAMGRNRSGEMVQTGGFGYLFGDTAGGYHLAAETFRAAVRSMEFRAVPSKLPAMVAAALGFSTMEQAVDQYLDQEIYHVPAELAIVAHEAANLGDALAISLLQEMGRELGLAAISVLRKLGGFGGDPFPVVLVGSVFQKGRNTHILETLQTTVHELYPEADFVIPKMAPVYGSILLGMDHLGLPIPAELSHKFESYGGYAE